MIQKPTQLATLIIALYCSVAAFSEAPAATDAMYEKIRTSVEEADFAMMAAAYHPDAILVSNKGTNAVAGVIPRWKAAGEKLDREGGVASVEFRFSSRQVDDTTAFEAGIFKYQTIDATGNKNANYIHFENLSIKQEGEWRFIMERQKDAADQTTWDTLSSLVSE